MPSSPSLSQLQRLAASVIGVPPWQGMVLAGIGIYANGPFTNVGGGQVAAQYRTWKLLNSVEVIGCVSLPGSALNNNAFIAPARLPIPASIQQIPLVVEGNSAAAIATPYLKIDQFGVPSFQNIPSTATKASFHGWYSLDA